MGQKNFVVESSAGVSGGGRVGKPEVGCEVSTGEGGMRNLMTAWTGKACEAAELEAQARVCLAETLEKTEGQVLQLSSAVDKLQVGFDLLQERMERIDRRLESLEPSLNKLLREVEGLSSAVAVFERNLEQVRLLMERGVAKADRLSQEFIEHQVREPLLKGIGNLYSDMRQVMNDGDGMAFVMERTRTLIESHGIRLIDPKEGTPFDPREHQAIESLPTSSKRMGRRVAKVHRVGLKGNGRVIQQALIGLYFVEKSASRQEKEQGGEEDERAEEKYPGSGN